jgi:prepilin-type N-terminal cleavage/methylation domain-containing protein
LRLLRRIVSGRSAAGQAGYTLIEMIMVIAILGLLTVAVNQAIGQAVRVSSRGTESMTAIKQIENAFHWVTIDVQQSRIVEPELVTGFPLDLSWVGWDGHTHAITYSVNGSDFERIAYLDGELESDMVAARYISTDATATYCRLTGSGTFSLPDAGDSFNITGGQTASSGQISVSAGSVSVTTTGTATYDSGAWSTPAAGDTVTVTAASSGTRGTWSSENTEAVLQKTQDTDGDAVLRGSALMLTITAFGGDGSHHSETRQGMIFTRS